MTDALWLGWLCANFDVLRRLDPPEAERLLTAVRAGRDEGAHLAVLSRDLDLPAAEDVWRGPDPGPPGMGALRPGRPSADVLVCPGARCQRTVVRRSGVPVPFCAVDGVRLRPARA